ncbi:hypothetical protein QBC35DRAFT_475868 [Podospora australis]|uniref:Zn(2)-C6 fungal-type domain-containing protein n=1 Tax=Podospora australis TaxID=1536484 RepID=A0AAN6WT59_9PEZI|nr:hypothetical protein QBC35DRAFT_475868 [Podospora australis]
MEESKIKKTGEQPKRRACDECRGRKLACSKNVNGCTRCSREGIKCVYSVQKPMGRPRKRQNPGGAVTVEIAVPKPDDSNIPTSQKALPTGFATVEIPEFDPTMTMDLDLSFLDVDNDFNFFDLMNPATDFDSCALPASNEPLSPSAFLPPTTALPTPPSDSASPPSGFWPMGDHLGHIDFNSEICAQEQPAKELTNEEIACILTGPETYLESTLPGLSPPSSSSNSSNGDTSSPSLDNNPPQETCSCLASLYLALESVKTLPQPVARALRITRAASRAAHDAVLCRVCSDIPLSTNPADLPPKTPMASIQNMMMLGALLPSLSNAYMRILQMIDAEAAEADRLRKKIKFTLTEYGGLWGVLAEQEPFKCGAAERIEGTEMEPSLWRLTIRALLKVDVYGVDTQVLCPDARHLALKDIIGMLEERSRNRHQMLDEMVEAGIIERPKCGDYIPLTSPEKPTCLRIIDMAKKSMDELVIP